MDFRNCKMCGRIYRHINLPYCPSCLNDWEEMFVKVRDYIWDNPKANVKEVSDETGVEEKIILEFLREGRIELTTESIGFSCERCNTPIKSGRYCDSCAKKMATELKKGLSTSTSDRSIGRDGKRMYTADRTRKRRS